MFQNDSSLTQSPPLLPGGVPWLGHVFQFMKNPYQFLQTTHEKLGQIVSFKIMGREIVLLSGFEASQAFYKASEAQLDQSAAYNRLMKPIFGEGIIFDASAKRKEEQLRMLIPALRMDAMKSYAGKIALETNQIVSDWGDSGEIDLMKFMQQLTINTASRCLLGEEFRSQLNDEFLDIYHDLEKGVHPLAYYYPNLPIPVFRRRDRARNRLQQLVSTIVKNRQSQKEKPRDMLQLLIDSRYENGSCLSANEITGMLLTILFAGHHTSAGTLAWVILELIKSPSILKDVRAEIGAILGESDEVHFEQVRKMHHLENVIKEVLRLHPPLIVLMREVSEKFEIGGFTISKGALVWTSPPVTHRMKSLFSDPENFDPSRFDPQSGEQDNTRGWQPFGGGKHKCSGSIFAIFQIKVILSKILMEYDFEFSSEPDQYVDDYREMIVQPKTPCLVRYKKVERSDILPREEPIPSVCPFTGVETTGDVHLPKCPFANS